MQHPVGVEMVDGRPVMIDAWAVFTNNTALVAFPHTIFGAFAVAGGFLLGISWYHLWQAPPRRHRHRRCRRQRRGRASRETLGRNRDKVDHTVWIKSLRIGAVVAMIAFAGRCLHRRPAGKLMFEQQPMKMAAAEAACHDGTGFSLLSVGDLAAAAQRPATTWSP